MYHLIQNESFANRRTGATGSDFNANYPNLQAHTQVNPVPPATTEGSLFTAQFKRMQQQQQEANERKKKLDALVQAKRAERQLGRQNEAPPVLALTHEMQGEKSKNTENDAEEQLDWADETGNEIVLQRGAQPLPALEQVAQALEKHKKGREGEGEDVELLKLTVLASLKAPKQGQAGKMTVADLMPSGQTSETGQVDPNMVANLPDRQNCAEFF